MLCHRSQVQNVFSQSFMIKLREILAYSYDSKDLGGKYFTLGSFLS